MQHPVQVLAPVAAQTLNALYGLTLSPADVALQETRKEFAGDFTLVVFPYTRLSKLAPEATGAQIGAAILEAAPGLVRGFNVVKGFLNLELADQAWLTAFAQASQAERFGAGPAKGQRVMVEYSSPNTNKPLHLGHMRNIFLGSALSNLLELSGFDVVRANLVNDRGIHICKSMVAYQKLGQGETPASSGFKGDHLVGKYYVEYDKAYKTELAALKAQGKTDEEAEAASTWAQAARQSLELWEAGDPDTVALWKQMNGWVYEGFEATYKRMGTRFDKFYYESDTYLLGKDIVEEGLAKGVFYQKEDKSVWIDLTAEGLDHKLVLRGNGTSVYITQDLGTADLKAKEYALDRSVYVVGNEQDYHFAVLFAIMRRLGRPYAEGLFHLSYGMVDLPSGRMKSREGTVVDADDLMEETVEEARNRTAELGKIAEMSAQEAEALYEMLGLGALKYFLLKVEPKKRMTFNPAESIDLQGNTATAIQYSHARICSVLRKAAAEGLEAAATPDNYTLHPDERALIAHLATLPEVVEKAAAEMAPSPLAAFSYDASRAFNKFFTSCSILSADTVEQKRFRLALCELTARCLRTSMGVLGVALPERM